MGLVENVANGPIVKVLSAYRTGFIVFILFFIISLLRQRRVKGFSETPKETRFVDASGLKLSRAAGVALQQTNDGRVTLGAFDELL